MLEPSATPIQMICSRRFWRTLCLLLSFIGISSCSALFLRPSPLTPATAAIPPQIAEQIAVWMNDEPMPGASQPAAIQPNLMDELLQPFVIAALKARAERAARDPNYLRRIDPDLNRQRINFLLFGYGETYEPPSPKDIIGSITIMSLDMRTRKFAQISLTHDARAPEIERYMQARGLKTNPSKIDTAYKTGGFDLMRLAVENATGLAIDFQLAIEDVVVKYLVDEVLGGIEVENPFDLSVNPIYLQGVRYPGAHFPKGRQTCDGLKTMSYLKGLSLPPYDAAKENNIRKHIVFRSLGNRVEDNVKNPLFALKALSFLHAQLDRKSIAYDFDIKTLLLDGLKQLASSPLTGKLIMPAIDQNIYLVDQRFGDGGFAWVMGTQNPIIKDELKRGIYKDTAMVVPNGNPYAENLASGYWSSVRVIVRQKLIYGNTPIQTTTCRDSQVFRLRTGNRPRCTD